MNELYDGTGSGFVELTRMILVKVDASVMLSTGVTATAGMLSMLAYSSVSVTDMAAQLPRLLLILAAHLCAERTTTVVEKTRPLRSAESAYRSAAVFRRCDSMAILVLHFVSSIVNERFGKKMIPK